MKAGSQVLSGRGCSCSWISRWSRLIRPSDRQSSIRGLSAPHCAAESTAPHGFLGSEPTGATRGHVLMGDRADGMASSGARWEPPGGFRGEAVRVGDGPREAALLHAQARRLEVRTVTQHREENPTQTMGNGHDGGLVATPGADPGEVGRRSVRRRGRSRASARRRATLVPVRRASVEGADLRGGLAPDGVVVLEVTGEIPGHHIRGEQARPMGIGAQTRVARPPHALPHEAPRRARYAVTLTKCAA
jgi:hypothetical protein